MCGLLVIGFCQSGSWQKQTKLRFGGAFVQQYTTHGAADGSGLPSTYDGCYAVNPATSGCSCPTGYTVTLSALSQAYMSYPFDKTFLSFVCAG